LLLRDGSTTADPRLGRLPSFDPNSRQFPIRTLLPARPLRSYTWSCATILDQGNVGACTGFAWAHELAARPKIHPADNALGMSLYHQAQQLDEWPGSDYEGSSVLGAAKAVQQRGYMREYRWAFGLQDALAAIAWHGPVIFGINWHRGMSQPDAAGLIHATGPVDGGHAIMGNAVSLRRQAVRLQNSWGRGFGIDGSCWISFSDLEYLLQHDGECCVPTQRL
jgi:hypothetical protein